MIQTGDIKLLKSQVMLDTADGGGAMTGNEVVDGQSNNLFPDISELDRTYGRISLRKAFAAVLTATVDSYYGSHAIISKRPLDPRVGVTLFTNQDWFDRRSDAKDRVESYLVRGPKWAGHLLEMQLSGQRAIQIVMRQNDDTPKVGQGLCLVQDEGLASEQEQYVRVTAISTVDRTFAVKERDAIRKVVTLEISDPLRHDFNGVSVEQYETGATPQAVCRDTRVANASKYYGIEQLAEDAPMGAASVRVAGIFAQLVPSAQSETPLIDQPPVASRAAVVKASTTPISTTLNVVLGPSKVVYLGSPFYPGSLTLAAGVNTLRDSNGVVLSGTTEVGTCSYSDGTLTLSSASPNYTGNASAVFLPAAALSTVQETASIAISQDRGYNYVMTLRPTPQPGTLIVSYMAQGNVYYLYDQGAGVLRGTDAAFGSGTVSFTTGSVIVTTGALPDVGTDVIFTWGTSRDTFVRTAGTPVIRIEFALAHEQVVPNTLELTWTENGESRTASDDGNGNITGNMTGKIQYATGALVLFPSTLYNQGTEITVSYQHGTPHEHRFDMPSRGPTGDVSLSLPDMGGSVIPGTVELTWNVDIIDSETLGQIWTTSTSLTRRDPLVHATDDGEGALVRDDGETQPSTVDYVAHSITFTPEYTVQIPKPISGRELMGSQLVSRITGNRLNLSRVDTWRSIISGWQMVPTIATMPYDEKGYAIVRWRTSASANAATETLTVNDVKFDVTPGYGESIISGSARFTLGGKSYIERSGALYHSISATTGAGTYAGTLDTGTGIATLTSWTPGASAAVVLQGLATHLNASVVDEATFRVPIAPIRAGSFQVRAKAVDTGAEITATVDSYGRIEHARMLGDVNIQTGTAYLRFGSVVTVTPEITAQEWFDAGAVFTEGGFEKVVQPRPVYGDSIRYNAVAYTYLPLSSDVLGLDPVRLPSDGRVPVFQTGDVVVVHNTQNTAFALGAGVGAAVDCGRVRLSYAKVYDAAGMAVDESMYSANLDAGTVTLGASFVLGSYAEPLYVEHRIEDMALAVDVQINGQLRLNKQLTHDYDADTSYVSSALIMGDLQARSYNGFAQTSWTGEWSDSRIGSTPIAQYNSAQYPWGMTNRGATQERWALIFTSATQFRVVGEHVGQIATGDVNTVCAPINPATGEPYFTINPAGWGGGWAAGNVWRENTAAANYPLWVARTVLQGPVGEESDGFRIQIRGDIDR